MSSLLNKGKGTGRRLAKAGEPDPAATAAASANGPAATEPETEAPVEPSASVKPEAAAPVEISPEQPPAAEVERSGEDAAVDVIRLLAEMDYAAIAKVLPRVPAQSAGDKTALAANERAEFKRAERILAVADSAFWVQGRTLEAIRNSRYYTEEFDSFDTYCVARWQKGARRVNQLIEVWRLAEHLLVNVGTRYPTTSINESHTKALLGFAREQGHDAAAFILEALLRSNVKLTAARISAALDTLPSGPFNADAAALALAEFVQSGASVVEVEGDGGQGRDSLGTEVGRLRNTAMRIARRDPAATRRLVEELAELLEELRKQLDG